MKLKKQGLDHSTAHTIATKKYNYQKYGELGFVDEKDALNHFALGEYFSEGYKACLLSPEVLKVKDVKLYQYIKELIGDGK